MVTGATGTIGFETYKMFKNYGAEVILLDFNKQKIKNGELKKILEDKQINFKKTKIR